MLEITRDPGLRISLCDFSKLFKYLANAIFGPKYFIDVKYWPNIEKIAVMK